ncbi:uncharacterized protein LOC128220497 [Mya arenaria]|uniref:uncharacterized protein LOC128220497 n=1 Tax=Mya arenaria TaxID=6604 RepID=UPI0022E37128|nr:uncharacterized protein LOC128220497 [Mya arenaria]
MGCCCSRKKKVVRWQVADEGPADEKFTNKEWLPKIITKKPRYAHPVGSFGVKILDDEQECNITGAAFLPNGDIFLVDKANKKLKLFDKKSYKFIMSSQVPSYPESACGIPDSPNVFVTFPASSRIRNIGMSRSEMQRVDTVQTIGRCTAISSNKYGGLAVAVNMMGNQWQIHLMNAAGKVQKKIHSEMLFVNPEHIAITPELNLVVSDKGNNTIFHLTPEGYVIFAYKDLLSPKDVFVDKKGYIYVIGSDRIHQLNERGEKVQYMLSKAEIGFSPQTLAYREKDEFLLVAGRSDKVKVYAMS